MLMAETPFAWERTVNIWRGQLVGIDLDQALSAARWRVRDERPWRD
jgi:hypothetical protein